jgi:hypothetical protein
MEIGERPVCPWHYSIIPAVDEQRPIGIVTLQNLTHSMALLAESRTLRRQEMES